jgi:hypothetical protein
MNLLLRNGHGRHDSLRSYIGGSQHCHRADRRPIERQLREGINTGSERPKGQLANGPQVL